MYFDDFLQKSTFHGLNFIGEKNDSVFKKIFWVFIFIVCVTVFSFLANSTISDFLSTKTKIQIAETNANLSEVVFPAVFVCNNNQFRRSFVYRIIDMLKTDGELDDDPIIKEGVKRKLTEKEQDVFNWIRDEFFRGRAMQHETINTKLIDKIINSTFLKTYMDEFLDEKKILNKTITYEDRNTLINILTDTKFYGNESLSFSKRMRNFVAMAGQWKIQQMIPYVEWKGRLNKSDKNDEIHLGLQQPTSSGICAWIAPLAHKVNYK